MKISSYAFWAAMSLLLLVSLIAILILSPDLYVSITNESTGTELLTAIFYLLAGFLLIVTALLQHRNDSPRYKPTLTMLLGLFFIFIAGEEESWGQWLFHYGVSTNVKAINLQNETNIHNLNIFYGAINSHTVLNLFVLLFGIIVPLLHKWLSQIRELLRKLVFPIVPLYLVPLFVTALAYEKIAWYISTKMLPKDFEHWRHAEAMEFLFSIGFLVFALHWYRQQKNSASIEYRHDQSNAQRRIAK